MAVKKARPKNPLLESDFAVMREALQHTLASHNNTGRAQPCTCSLCHMVRQALKPGAAADYANRVRQECIQVVEWKISELRELKNPPAALTVMRELADMLRILTLPL